MEGVILFADDHIYSADRPERLLFESLRENVPTLGVHSLEFAAEAVKSIGTFKAIILDWQYSSKDTFEDILEELEEPRLRISVGQNEDAAYKFLNEKDFYSLIYIFSEIDIEELYGETLRKKFGDRIHIRRKDETFTKENIEKYKTDILTDIHNWETNHNNLSVPIKWSISINESLQQIFTELSTADINWIINLYQTATDDGVNPEIEVINLLHNILGEKLITNADLRGTIKDLVVSGKGKIPVLANGASIARLFQRIYYTDLRTFSIEEVPVMTGDIFLLDPATKTYGIIISPECDIQDICSSDLFFEFLTFKETDFNLKTFIELFGSKNSKLSVNNKPIVEAINIIIKEKFKKFSPASQPPQLFKKDKVKKFVENENGEITKIVETEFNPIEEDVLVKVFLSQFEILVNKHVDTELRVLINGQIGEQNDKLLNDLLLQSYNQTEKRIHLIPSFPFEVESASKSVVIDFRTGKAFKKNSELTNGEIKRICKLNNPFIPELRQRYLAYYGRVGVPKIPTVLREHNLKSFD